MFILLSLLLLFFFILYEMLQKSQKSNFWGCTISNLIVYILLDRSLYLLYFTPVAFLRIQRKAFVLYVLTIIMAASTDRIVFVWHSVNIFKNKKDLMLFHIIYQREMSFMIFSLSKMCFLLEEINWERRQKQNKRVGTPNYIYTLVWQQQIWKFL